MVIKNQESPHNQILPVYFTTLWKILLTRHCIESSIARMWKLAGKFFRVFFQRKKKTNDELGSIPITQKLLSWKIANTHLYFKTTCLLLLVSFFPSVWEAVGIHELRGNHEWGTLGLTPWKTFKEFEEILRVLWKTHKIFKKFNSIKRF